MRTASVLVLAGVTVLIAGCISADSGIYSSESDTRVDLSKGNYRVLKSDVRGTSWGFNLLGIPLAVPSYGKAMSDLRSEVDMEGKAAALTNVTQDRWKLSLLLFSIPKISVTADVIEFTGG